MKMRDAINIMESKSSGFFVAFENVVGGMLESDHFPDVRNGECAIPTESEAWDMAAKFAAKTRERRVNIYVIHSEDFTPVYDYRERMIENR